jgi:hypothetical protein
MTPIQSLILKAICINVPIGILLLGPKDAVLKYIWAHRHDEKSSLRMWHYETLAVCALVAAVVILSGNDPVEWVGFAALTLAHGRNSVMFRLTEVQQRSSPVDPHHVECWRWNTIYFLLAECFWAGYFVLHRSWAALAGVAIFVGYGQWRRWYGRRQQYLYDHRWDCAGCQDEDLRKGGRTVDELKAEGLVYDEEGDCRLCGERKYESPKTKGRVYADYELTEREAWDTPKECDAEDCQAPLQVGHHVCPECRTIQVQPKFKEPDLIRVHPSTCMCNVCMTTT